MSDIQYILRYAHDDGEVFNIAYYPRSTPSWNKPDLTHAIEMKMCDGSFCETDLKSRYCQNAHVKLYARNIFSCSEIFVTDVTCLPCGKEFYYKVDEIIAAYEAGNCERVFHRIKHDDKSHVNDACWDESMLAPADYDSLHQSEPEDEEPAETLEDRFLTHLSEKDANWLIKQMKIEADLAEQTDVSDVAANDHTGSFCLSSIVAFVFAIEDAAKKAGAKFQLVLPQSDGTYKCYSRRSATALITSCLHQFFKHETGTPADLEFMEALLKKMPSLVTNVSACIAHLDVTNRKNPNKWVVFANICDCVLPGMRLSPRHTALVAYAAMLKENS